MLEGLVFMLFAQAPEEQPAQPPAAEQTQPAATEQAQPAAAEQERQVQPQAKVEVKPTWYYDGETRYVHPEMGIKLEYIDDLSGVKEVKYMLDYDGQWRIYQDVIKVEGEGYHVILYQASDEVGNVTKQGSFEVFVDSSAPLSTLFYEGELYQKDGQIFVSPDNSYFITSKDGFSGVAKIYYRIDGGEVNAYEKSFKLEGEGEHTIGYYAVDNVGNVEEEKSLKVIVDATAPEVKIVPNPELIEKEGVKYAGKGYTFAVEANDTGCGVKKILVSIDGRPYVEYKTPISFVTGGEHTIAAKAVDMVGNESEPVVLKVTVDILPPSGGAKLGE